MRGVYVTVHWQVFICLCGSLTFLHNVRIEHVSTFKHLMLSVVNEPCGEGFENILKGRKSLPTSVNITVQFPIICTQLIK